jgi:hypothetical protein
MTTTNELSEQIAELVDETRRLRQATEAVVPSVKREVRRGRVTRILLGVQAAVLIAVVVLGIVLVGVVHAQDRTTQQALCPVFALLIGGYNPDSRPAGAARDTYNQQFQLFSQAYAALDCNNPIVPPAIRS